MGTWISHLRVAENLLRRIPGLDEAGFTYGNLAPDSGVPNADWSAFDPPKTVTHMAEEGGIPDLEFYRAYVLPEKAYGGALHSFQLGYFFHLICDNLWWWWVVPAAKREFATLFAQAGNQAWWTLKRDWYDLDHKFVRDHPESLYWRVFRPAPLPALGTPFVPQHALHHQMQHIKDFYADPGERVLDRAYPYLNEATMDRFVNEATEALVLIRQALTADEVSEGYRSTMDFLGPERLRPFPSPLGDGA